MPPQSPAPFFGAVPNRQSAYSNFTPYTDAPTQVYDQHHMSMAGISDQPYADNPFASRPALVVTPSTDNLIAMQSPSHPHRQSRSSLGFTSRPVSTLDFQRTTAGPDDGAIVEAIRSCLSEVDLDTVTKKQVRALVEQRLQTELVGERRAFLDRWIDDELENM